MLKVAIIRKIKNYEPKGRGFESLLAYQRTDTERYLFFFYAIGTFLRGKTAHRAVFAIREDFWRTKENGHFDKK